MSKVLSQDRLPDTVTFDQISERLFKQTYAGYCLWVGAGVTHQLTKRFAKTPAMLWGGLVSEMEKATFGSVNESGALIERLDAIQKAIGPEQFQRKLRELFLLPLCQSLTELENFRSVNQTEFFKIINPIMKLGLYANPIVNFNIEHYTSILLAFPLDYSITSFKQIPPGEKDLLDRMQRSDAVWQARKDNPRFKRRIYHPHGVLNLSGTCVLSQSEYDSLTTEKVLGFRLAIHTAFHLPLVIVGMSLGDKYLREQLEIYRSEIDEIYWFVDVSISDEDRAWAKANRITLVVSPSWDEFWSNVHTSREVPKTDEYVMNKAWEKIREEAFDITNGNEQIRRALLDERVPERDKIGLRQLAIEMGIKTD